MNNKVRTTATWAASSTIHDILSRVSRSSVPTEISVSGTTWTPAGDDYTRGWIWNDQKYDWRRKEWGLACYIGILAWLSEILRIGTSNISRRFDDAKVRTANESEFQAACAEVRESYDARKATKQA